jgi:DMSO/TMAO reductase YedYZ heme-binding membrane subunit
MVMAIVLSVVEYVWVNTTVSSPELFDIRLTQVFGFTALAYLYVALLVTPFNLAFPRFRYRGLAVVARRSIGVSAWYFSVLHAYHGFFRELGGFAHVFSLPMRYLIAILLSAIAFVILTIMASTSFDSMVKLLSARRWKMIHRLVHLACTLVLVHVALIGSHMNMQYPVIVGIVWGAVLFLLILQARRVDLFLQKRYVERWRHHYLFYVLLGLSVVLCFYFLSIIS